MLCWRQTAFLQLTLALASATTVVAQEAKTSRMPTWDEEIAKGLLPYHQLAVEDFRIDDKAHPELSYSVKPFMDPRWHFIFTNNGGWYYAYVDQWVIFSGLDRNESSRKSKFKEMQRALPYAQAFLDLNEIYARQLAALKPGELPSGRGATLEEGASALHQNMEAFLKEKYKPLYAEAEEFQKATKQGTNTKKVRELGNAFRKRLDALPVSTGPGYDLPAATPAPSPSSTPKK
jgi:hypothetical protein